MSSAPEAPKTSESNGPAPDERIGLFRAEAVKSRFHSEMNAGRLIKYSPFWLSATFWVLTAGLVAGLVVAVFARGYEWTRGPVLVTATTKEVVSSPLAGVTARVVAVPGHRIEANEPLVVLVSDSERAEVQRLQALFDQQLARSLLDRSDLSLRDSLVSLRRELDAAVGKLNERIIRAPCAGVVSDVRARPGQFVPAGSVVASVVSPGSAFEAIAVLPGYVRPQLRPGAVMRLELDGYPYEYQSATIAAVSDEIVGPAEVKRFLGADVEGSILVSGPSVIVRASLSSRSFVSDGRALQLHDGMTGRALVAGRHQRLVFLLAPWLRTAFGVQE
jgi:membrane fusion protein (multidrug efflux system)